MKVQLARKRIARYALILFAGIALLLFSDYLGLFEGVDLYGYDLSFRLRGHLKPDDSIVIAAIDEKTLASLGRWPIRREYYAQLIRAAKESRVIGFDIIMAESSADDGALNAAMSDHGRVVLPVYVGSDMHISQPARTLAAAKTGHIHVEQGIDGIVRSVFHTIESQGFVLPSFASVVYQLLTGDALAHRDPAGKSEEGAFSRAIVQSNPMGINFFGPPGTFRHISFIDVIGGRYPPSFFRDKIVLVGLTAPGVEEKVLTPFTQHRDRMAGVEVHANILNSMIAGNSIRTVRDEVRWVLTVIVSIASFVLFLRANERKATFLWILGLLLTGGIAFSFFAFADRWAGPTLPLAAITAMFVTAYVVKLEEMGKLLQRANDEWDRTFNDIHDAIIVRDRDFRVVRANRSADAILGTDTFSDITKVCREKCEREKTGKAHSHAGREAPEPHMMEWYDAEKNRHLEILTIPRLDDEKRSVGVIQIIRDITERKEAEAAIEASREQLRNLAAHIQKMSEIERTNIAREIHDELGQALTVLKIDLSWLLKRLTHDQAPLIAKIDDMVKIVDRTITTVKKLSTDLRPGLLDDLGLSAAIEWQTGEFEKRTGIPCRLTILPQDVSFDKERNTALFRILQETLTNIARHAEATEVDVSLRVLDGTIQFTVKDNGRGIRQDELKSPQSFGLMGIQERARLFGGHAVFEGVPGRGTTVTVTMPATDEGKGS